MLSNSYWKGKSIDEYDIVINLCCVCTNDFFEGIEDHYDEYTYRMVYTIKSIELVDKCYLKTRRHYRPERFVEKTATVQNATTVTVNDAAGTNPVTLAAATKKEFNIYINGQYIDKALYTWTPTTSSPQTIVFDTTQLDYELDSNDIIIINGRWTLNP
jgi:hypothetical protein